MRLKKHKKTNSKKVLYAFVFTLVMISSIFAYKFFPTSSDSFVSHAETTNFSSINMSGLHVQGNQILNGDGQPVVLKGVNRSGTEYACVQGWGFFDGPSDLNSILAMKSLNINSVRVPLNEDCWLGINGVPSQYSGANYQQAIVNYVNLLTENGLAAVVELHWSAPGTQQATGQQPMPDMDHSSTFWQSVASTFQSNSAVIFDLFNEPYPDGNRDSVAAWTCLRDGGTCSGVSYTAAGMQTLVDSVRSTGATNLIMVPGVQYTNTLSQWLAYKPTDSLNNLAASWHGYNFNICTTTSCWDQQLASVNQQIPLVAGEIGENDCAHTYIDSFMNWADSNNIGYLAWTWDTWGCNSISLISNYDGTPTNYGIGFKNHLAQSISITPLPTSVIPTLIPTSVLTPTPTSIIDTIAPVVTISNPADGSTVSGRVNITASATDNVRVAKMELYIDSVLTKNSKGSSFIYGWNTRNISAGAHRISVTAYDPSNNMRTMTITVYK